MLIIVIGGTLHGGRFFAFKTSKFSKPLCSEGRYICAKSFPLSFFPFPFPTIYSVIVNEMEWILMKLCESEMDVEK